MSMPDLPEPSRTYAVLGATGQQGGAVARALLAQGDGVRALVRDPAKQRARELADLGAELVVADVDDPESLFRGFAGVDGVFAMTTPFDGGPEAETRQGIVVVDAAAQAQVPHLVFSSVGGAERETGIPHFESKRRVEEHLRALELPATIVRPVFFMENLVQLMPPQEEDGALVLRAPLAPGVPLQMVAVRDIGRVVAVVLRDPSRVPGGAVEIAGDELVPEEIAAAFGAAAGQPARFESLPVSILPDEDSRRMFTWFAEPPAYAADFDLTRRLDPDVLDLAGFLRQRA